MVRPRPNASFPPNSAVAVATTNVSTGHMREFSSKRTTKSVCGKLEHVADDVEVSCREDEEDRAGKGDGSRARVLPLQRISTCHQNRTDCSSRSGVGKTSCGSLSHISPSPAIELVRAAYV